MLERFFSLREHQTSVSQEVVAGLTTFAAMAYILEVNPSILSTTGMDKGALITATAVASGVMTTVMALATNYPIALAPGMGLNAFFAFTLCGAKGIPWQAALGLVFYSGLIFLTLSVTGLRKKLVAAIPLELKLAITAGIGFFIAFIGLKSGGVVVANPATFVGLADLSKPGPLLVIAGIIATAILVTRKIPGAIVLVILALSIIGLIVPAPDGKGMITALPSGIVNLPASLAPTFLKLDLTYFWKNFLSALPVVLAILFVDLFDNMGTLIGVSKRAGLLDKEGNLPKIGQAFMADAGAAMFGSSLGTSTVTSYVESTAGVAAGGRSGITAIVTGLLFLVAMVAAPFVGIVPSAATAPALILVGSLMLATVTEIRWTEPLVAVPAFLTLILIPLTYSIANGLGFGIIAWAVLHVAAGKFTRKDWLLYLLAGLFLVRFVYLSAS